MSHIKIALRRDDTILRLGGDCYGAALTWTADDRQLLAIIDGAGWPEIPKNANGYYCSRLFAVEGNPRDAVFRELGSYPDIFMYDYLCGFAPYYGLSALAIDECIYQLLSTENLSGSNIDMCRLETCESVFADISFTNTKLIYSPDNGRTWRNQDGSTPVMFESRQDQSRENMLFFQEPQRAFAYPSFLQMGKGYQDNRDGYVYIYAPNGYKDGTMNELVMCRVPKGQMLERDAYRFFSGLRSDGAANWDKDINARHVVYTFPLGWTPRPCPIAWVPSVIFNAPLGIYMMANCSGVSAVSIATKPAYFGIWIAPNPWGPWSQILEETAWMPDGDAKSRAAAPQIAPKWVAKDGKSCWLVWTDMQHSTSEDLDTPCFLARTETQLMEARSRWRRFSPYFGFNTQRVDLGSI